MLKLWIKSLRIKHWIKNLFVFIPFLVGPNFGLNEYLVRSIYGVLLFCMISSAVYLFNDIIDIKSDREHPEKRLRPIASGQIGISSAVTVSVFLAVSSLIISLWLDVRFFLLLVGYALNNLLYSFYLKKKTVIDVISIASGFVIRSYAGGVIIGIEVTKWLVGCVFALSLMLGFGKRRSEYGMLQEAASRVRIVHESYSIPKLDLLLGTSASVTILSYMIYSLSPEARFIHHTDKLIFTTPFVVYCVYRYMLKVQEARKGDPFEIMMMDTGFLVAGFMWVVLLMVLIHL